MSNPSFQGPKNNCWTYMQNSTLANSVQLTFAQLQSIQDEACRDSIQRMEATGQPTVTDGEQRASSFAAYLLTYSLGDRSGQEFSSWWDNTFVIFDDGYHRQLPLLVSGPFRYQTYASECLKRSLPMAKKANEASCKPSSPRLCYIAFTPWTKR